MIASWRRRRRLLVAALAAVVVVASVWAVTSLANTIYQQGAMDAVHALDQAHRDMASGNVEHGSPARVDPNRDGAYDESTMNPYDHKICDFSVNGFEAVSIAYNHNGDPKFAIDNNGAFGGCNHNNLPFRGVYHQACLGYLDGCGKSSFH